MMMKFKNLTKTIDSIELFLRNKAKYKSMLKDNENGIIIDDRLEG